jgi:UDP-N-acetylmuramate dehydrogenase
MKYQRKEALKKHTSFRIGGPADYFCVPKNVHELREALMFSRQERLPLALIGAGTNFLALDQGFRGLVIKIGRGLDKIEVRGNEVTVGAGVFLPRLLSRLVKEKLGGLEFLAGIPGSVGGAVIMNAGAWGRELGQLIQQVRVIDRAGKEKVLQQRQLGLGYRRSSLAEKNLIVTEVVFKLRRKKRQLIKKKIDQYLDKRKTRQPLGSPNCGSVFKNTRQGPAGWLIEAAGCKGWRVGDAQVSCKHANFILNLGEAKAKDVLKLVTMVRQAVKDKFKISLEPELKIMVKSSS